MIITPMINGVIAKSSHPLGCQESVIRQINYVKNAKQITNGPKKVLILGASSGLGLAARISLAFGGANADTIGVSFEKGPTEKGIGSAGWYNNIYFKQQAETSALIAKNFVGDAFSASMRDQVIDYIKYEFGGSVDFIIYSLATAVRPDLKTGQMWHSVLKPIDKPYTGNTINIELGRLEQLTIEPANETEIAATIKVMGGEDWQNWIEQLNRADVLAKGCQTIAYSYIGPESTYPIYHHGTLGKAKQHLHHSADVLNQKLSTISGKAYIVVCKALVTKASVFIPALSEYLLALFKVMKLHGIHEGCIEQMQRLFATKIFSGSTIITGEQRFIRMDDVEMHPDIQKEVQVLQKNMLADNFKTVGDYQGFISDFMQLNGFGLDNINYQEHIDINQLKKLQY